MIDVPALASLLQAKFMVPDDAATWVDLILRWIHFVAGITWIGLLYFFNLVNVPLMKALDGPTKGKVVPQLMPRALWWFRWGAVVTVGAGFLYWVLLQMREPQAPDGSPGQYLWKTLGLWLVTWAVAWAVGYVLVFKVPPVAKNGWVLAVILFVVLGGLAHLYVQWATYPGASNRVISIGVGGGFGLFMLLNVWGVIWPIQKRLIAWTKENAEKGTAIPPESAALARRAFLMSRANAWLSIAMLFFMAAASHFPIFVGG